ncbi:DUF2474 domain-containing protein [Cupriavidus sp. IDO]|nr:DUF2474 domain-containing protein [Cupriavidus sp. IDO]
MASERPGLPVWLRRVGWLVLIWLASVAALGVAAWLLRLVMQGVGFRS